MADRRHHHVPRRVRVCVEDRDAVLGAIDRRVRRVALGRGGRGGAEDALPVLGPGDVLDAPRRPQRPLGHDGAAYRRPACEPSLVFHVELRQFPHQTRAFNLTREELDARIVGPWIAGEAIEMDDYRWLPDRATLTIYEGPLLGPGEMGLGQGMAERDPQGEGGHAGGADRGARRKLGASDGRGLQGRARRPGRRRRDRDVRSGGARGGVVSAVAGERADRAVPSRPCGSCCTRYR